MVQTGGNYEIQGAIEQLCRHFIGPEPRMSLVPATVTREQTYKVIRKAIFEALFVKGRSQDSKAISARGAVSIYADDLRNKNYSEEADKLEQRLEELLDGAHENLDANDASNILRFLLLVSQPLSGNQHPLIGFGRTLFSPVHDRHAAQIEPSSDSAGAEPFNICLASLFMHRPLSRYPCYSRDLFEKISCTLDEKMLPVEDIHCAVPSKAYSRSIFEMLPGSTPYGHSLFQVKGMLDDVHDRSMRSTLFGALSRPNNHINVATLRLELPELAYTGAVGLVIPKAKGSTGSRSDDEYGQQQRGVTLGASEDNHSIADEGFSEVAGSLHSLSSLHSKTYSSDEAICIDSPPLLEFVDVPRYLTWENRERTYNSKEKPYLTEAKAAVFDAVYDLHMGSLCMLDPAYIALVPFRMTMAHLMQDTLNVLIGLPSSTYVFNEAKDALCLRTGATVSGLSCEALSSACTEFSAAGTRHLRLTAFCSPPSSCQVDVEGVVHEKGLVFRAFSSAVRSYLQCYRRCIVGLHSLSAAPGGVCTPLQLERCLKKHFEQLELLSILCRCEDEKNWRAKDFPNGIQLLSLLYKTATEAVGRCTYTLALMLLHESFKPYLMFISDWIFFGASSDQYEEFIIKIDDSKVACRDRRYWTEGFTLVEADGDANFPLFLKGLAKGIYVCGKSMHLLRLCCPDHFLCVAAEQEVPPLGFVYMHEHENNEVYLKCQTYVAKVKQMAKHKLFTRMAVIERRERAKQDLMVTAKTVAAQEVDRLQKKITELRKAEDAKKRQIFREMKEQMEEDLRRRANVAANEKSENVKYMQAILNREKALTEEEKKLEARARDELIEEYAQLSEAAARREQLAMWRVRRRKRDDARLTFLRADREQLQKEQNELAQSRSVAERSDVLPGSSEQQKSPAEPTAVERPAGSSDGDEDEGSAMTAEHPSAAGRKVDWTDVAGANAVDSVNRTPLDAPSVTASQSAAGYAKSRLDSAGVHQTGSHFVSLPSGMMQHVEPDTAAAGDHHIGLQSEDLLNRKPLVKAVAGCHVTALSEPSGKEKLSVVPVEGRHVSQESQPLQTQKLLAAVEGCHVSLETVSHDQVPHVASVEGRHMTLESKPEAGHRPCIAVSQDQCVSSESKPSEDEKPVRARVEGCHISVESESSPSVGLHVALVQGCHISLESEPAQLPRPHVRTVQGHHVSNQSDSVLAAIPEAAPDNGMVTSRYHGRLGQQQSLHLHSASDAAQQQHKGHGQMVPPLDGSCRNSPGAAHAGTLEHASADPAIGAAAEAVQQGAAVRSAVVGSSLLPSQGLRLHVAAVDGCHASAQSQETQAFRPHVARVVGHHVSMESESAVTYTRSSACLGTLSDISHVPYMITASSKGSSEQSEAGDRTGLTFLTNRSHRRSQATDTSDAHSSDSESRRLLASQPPPSSASTEQDDATAVLTGGRSMGGAPLRRARAHEESVYVDQQAVRVLKFKERNVKGHSSDSSVQKLLYGGTRAAQREESSGRATEESPSEIESVAGAIEHSMSTMGPRYDNQYSCFEDTITSDLMARISNHAAVAAHSPVCPYHGCGCPGGPDCVPMYEYTSLAVLMHKSLSEPLAAQVSLVDSSLLSYFMVELSIDEHFEALRRYLLMENGEYSQVMGDLLFEKLDVCLYARDVLNPVFLNQVLAKALQSSSDKTDPYAANLTFALRTVPTALSSSAPDVFNCLELKYKVDWPLNIVLSESTLAKYSMVFSFMLQLRRIVYALKEMWVMLKRAAVLHGSVRSTHLLQLQLFRHEMQHFVKVMQGYVANQVIDVAWREFQDSLHDMQNLDDLSERHAAYVNHCLMRCLLNKKASAVAKVINTMFGLILKLRGQLKSGCWQLDAISGSLQHPAFPNMLESYSLFKQYSSFLFKVITKLAIRGYQPRHLQELLLRMNFNDYYEQ